MLTRLAKQGLLLLLITALGITCANNSSSQEQTARLEKESTTPVQTASANSIEPVPGVECATILTTALLEEVCGKSGIVERISSVERKGSNCNRLYGVGKNAWGDELVFILTVLKDASAAGAGMSRMKKENAQNGLEIATGIGDEAFSLNFPDPLSKRKNHQLIFRKKGFLVELKTNESRSIKTPCPCFEMEKLKILATKIANKI